MNGLPGTMQHLCWSPWVAATQRRLPSTETSSEANRSSPHKTQGPEPPRPLLVLPFLPKRQKKSRRSHACLSETPTEMLRGRRKRQGDQAVHTDIHEWTPWTDLCIASSFFPGWTVERVVGRDEGLACCRPRPEPENRVAGAAAGSYWGWRRVSEEEKEEGCYIRESILNV